MTNPAKEKLKKIIAEIIYLVYSEEDYNKLVPEAVEELDNLVNKIDYLFTIRLKKTN